MKNNPSVAEKGTQVNWLRAARRLVTCGVLVVAGVSSAIAQTFATSTVGGSYPSITSGSADGTGTGVSGSRFSSPTGIAVDATGGFVYIADTNNHKIRRMVIATGAVSTIAGTGSASYADNVTTGLSASFNTPQGIALDAAAANLYVADQFNHVIRKISLTGLFPVSTLAGTQGSSGFVDNANALSAKFTSPRGLVVVGTTIYVADTGNNAIRRITLSGTNDVVVFAGSATGLSGTTDGVSGTSARFFQPYAITSDGTNLYVADRDNHAIRKIVIGTAAVSTFAGTIGTAGGADAVTGTSATFRNPGGITFQAGTPAYLYVSDSLNNTVRQINASTSQVVTISGTAGLTGALDGLGAAARFQGPSGLGVDASGAIFVADQNNHMIRRIGTASIPTVTTPVTAPVAVGATATFTITVGGNPTPTIQWERQPAAGGGFAAIANSGAYSGVTTTTLTITGTTALMNGDTFRATVTNGVSPTPSATSSAVALVVQQAPVITSAPSTTFSLNVPGTFTFVATGSPAPTFSIPSGSSPGSLDPVTGVYSYTPSSVGGPYNFVIQASNGVGTPAQQNFTLNVQNGASISTQPVNAGATLGSGAQFTVVAAGTPATFTYQWWRNPGGTSGFSPMADSAGVYSGTNSATLSILTSTLSMNGDQFYVVVSNTIGSPVTSSTVTLTIQQAPVITSLNSALFAANTANEFQVVATGTPAPTFSIISGSFPGSLNSITGLMTYNPGSDPGSVYSFTIQASNGVNPAAQQAFTLTVTPAGAFPAFTTQPVSVATTIGQPVTFTVVATGVPAPSYQWQYQPAAGGGFVNITDGNGYSGAQTATLSIANATTALTGNQYQCVASNIVNLVPSSATSNVATLTVNVGTIISTVAGTAGVSATVDGTGLAAQFTNPTSVAADASGNVFVADPTAHVIRKITPAGVVTVFAGSPGLAGSADGLGTAARFNGPTGVAVDANGNVYVADTFNHTIRGISFSGNVITLAGGVGSTGSVDGIATAARFNYPFSLIVDSNGTIFVSDTYNHLIRRIAQNGSVSTVAGTAGVRGTQNGTGTAARFAYPEGIAVDGFGFLYVADSGNGAIRVINVGTTEVGTYAGVNGTFGTLDGAPTVARFNLPNGVAIDSNRVVYVADTFSHTIRRIGASTGNIGSLPVAGDVSTLAGSAGQTGTSDGEGTGSRFNQPNGITVDASGNLYIADTQNRTIRRSGAVTAATITSQPSNTSTAPGGTATFTVGATGAPAPSNYRWQRKPADGSTDFLNLSDDSTYSGTTTATLTISNVASTMNNDQFRVVVSNFISPEAVSNAATLSTVIALPVITSASSASFRATELGAFTVTATGNPTPTYSLTNQPSWLSINSSTGVMSGTAPDTTGSPFSFTVKASNGATAEQTFTLTVTPAIVAPAITVQPVGARLARGQAANFSVTATGTALTYQWYKDNVAIFGATNATLSLSGTQYANAGNYTVTVTNTLSSVTSTPAALVIITPPTITQQPTSTTALVGGTATFTVVATGSPTPTYQWRANGVALAGQTNATLTLTGLRLVDAAVYDVLVNNDAGGLRSSLAQLSVVSNVTAPIITSSPASRTVVAGSSTVLSVGVSSPAGVSYQWRLNGSAIGNGVGATYSIPNAQVANAGNYDVVVSNAVGSATSGTATVTVISRSFAGYYTGTIGSGAGSFALYVRPDNTAVFLGFLTATSTGIRNTTVRINDSGSFAFSEGGAPVAGTIGSGGAVSGSLTNTGAALTGTKTNDFGSSLAASGFYQGAAVNTSSTISAIVTPAGQSFVLLQTTAADGGSAPIDGNNRITLQTARQLIVATVNPADSTISIIVTAGSVSTIFTGASESVLATQRLANISTRARVGIGDAVTIAGFVISGENSKPVLIRAIGPSLVTFGVTTALSAPKLELYRNNAVIASNTNWTTSGNTDAIVAATLQAGAFPLAATAADSVIFATLPPGTYTAVVSSANNTPGVALAEVYDLSAPAVGQKLFNISTRASTGTGDSILTAGIAISGSVPKRVLIRGVGPTLATSFGVAGALAQPQLTVIKEGTTVASNSNWNISADALAITAASTQVGAFPLVANNTDAAMIVSLAPGNYSAQLTGANGTAGIAIIEVYELP